MTIRPVDYLFVTNIPSPYQVDFFNALQRQGENFHVIFCAACESDRFFAPPADASFSMEVLSSAAPRWMKDWHRNPVLRERLDCLSPRLVVVGGSYFMPDVRTARSHCIKHNVPWIFWGENPFKKSASMVKRTLKQAYLAHFLGGAVGAIGIGSAARDVYSKLLPGRPTENIPYSPDLDKLLSPSPRLIEASHRFRRALTGTTDKVMVLFAGSLIPRKAPDLLLRAFQTIAAPLPDVHLIVAGDGPMKSDLQDAVAQADLGERVHFTGFLQQDRLMAAYLASDVFVLPTRGHEGWGVVVQEAMAAGLVVICSDVVAAGDDLVHAEQTGLRFESDNLDQLAKQLMRVCTDCAMRQRMSQAARAAVEPTGATAAARTFVEYARNVLNRETHKHPHATHAA